MEARKRGGRRSREGTRRAGRGPLAAAALLVAVGLAGLPAPAVSQGEASLAVMPLRPLSGLGREEAEAIGGLLEASLVNTGAFRVVERCQIAEVLAAQEFSVDESSDERFAVQVGRLLSAERILLGTVSRLGDSWFLTAKIIDVATGVTLRAEGVEAGSLQAMPAQAEVLARRLARPRPAEQAPAGVPAVGRPAPGSEARAPQGPPLEALPGQSAARLQREALEARRRQLAERRASLERRLAAAPGRSVRLRRGALVCYGLSGGLLLGSGVTLVLHLGAERGGASSGMPWGQLSTTFGIMGGLGALAATMLLLEREEPQELREAIWQVDEQIRLLETRIREQGAREQEGQT